MQKTTMRQAFEAARITPGGFKAQPALVRKLVRVMERGAGIKQRRRPTPKRG